MENQKGFSLIELLIVVVIIGIIAAIAIPNLLAARRAANEGSAISALRTLHSAEVTYSTSAAGGGNFADIATLSSVSLIDSSLGGATSASSPKSGYFFSLTKADAGSGTPSKFAIAAQPAINSGVAATGIRSFGIATEGVIYTGTATALTSSSGALSGTSTILN